MKQTHDTNNIIFSSIHNEGQHHTSEPPQNPVSATWSKRVTPPTSSSSIHNERQHHTSEHPQNPVSATWSKRMTPTTSSSLASTTNVNITPQNPPQNPVSATWSKRVTPPTSSSLASTTNVNITPQNPPPKTLLVPHEATAWYRQHHLL